MGHIHSLTFQFHSDFQSYSLIPLVISFNFMLLPRSSTFASLTKLHNFSLILHLLITIAHSNTIFKEVAIITTTTIIDFSSLY